VAIEASDTAQRVLDLCIRAFEYMPPVDVTFSDYLRALVTADAELNPDDPFDLRANLVDSFAARGIYPRAFSLNEESLLWPTAGDAGLGPLDPDIVASLMSTEARSWGSTWDSISFSSDATKFHEYATDNWKQLGLADPSDGPPIAVSGFHSMFRVGSDGQLLTEAGVQFTQTAETGADADLGGLTPRAGATVVFAADGTPRYVISKPLPHDGLDEDDAAVAAERLDRMAKFVSDSDDQDPYTIWADNEHFPADERMLLRYDFAAVHQGIRRHRRSNGR
jgi:hypothetical protein